MTHSSSPWQATLRRSASNLDVAACLAHLPREHLASPEYTGDDAASITSGEPLPKLPANTRKSIASIYNHPMHNYKILLQALSTVLQSSSAEEVYNSMPPLSRRLLNETRLLNRLVDKIRWRPEAGDPGARGGGALEAEVAKRQANNGKFFWSNRRRKSRRRGYQKPRSRRR